MPADRFFSYAERLISYEGAVQARVRAEIIQEQNEQQNVPVQRQAPAPPTRNAHDVIEYADDGTRILNGVAVNEHDVPLWVTRLPGYNPNDCVVLPADQGLKLLASSPAFQGVGFSYAEVTAGDAPDE
jgi:hypothetical protein